MPELTASLSPNTIQSGILAYRMTSSGIKVLLVTSRNNENRWLLPKGGVSKNMTPWKSAAKEALEEAGVQGRVCDLPVGTYIHTKTMPDGSTNTFPVVIYPMLVTKRLDTWHEKGERKRAWMTIGQAMVAIQESDLKLMICAFAAGVRAASSRKPQEAKKQREMIKAAVEQFNGGSAKPENG
jgi:ADP-ribose pyrophosphatase YjhB (NUDIX family)